MLQINEYRTIIAGSGTHYIGFNLPLDVNSVPRPVVPNTIVWSTSDAGLINLTTGHFFLTAFNDLAVSSYPASATITVQATMADGNPPTPLNYTTLITVVSQTPPSLPDQFLRGYMLS